VVMPAAWFGIMQNTQIAVPNVTRSYEKAWLKNALCDAPVKFRVTFFTSPGFAVVSCQPWSNISAKLRFNFSLTPHDGQLGPYVQLMGGA
jgi:hypothetical protein